MVPSPSFDLQRNLKSANEMRASLSSEKSAIALFRGALVNDKSICCFVADEMTDMSLMKPFASASGDLGIPVAVNVHEESSGVMDVRKVVLKRAIAVDWHSLSDA